MDITYAEQTTGSPNPIRRFAHRNRLSRSVRLAISHAIPGLPVLDFGCGSGAFVEELLKRSIIAFGYEPFLDERSSAKLPIFSQLCDLESHGPYGLITLFETVEHLSDEQLDSFLAFCQRRLSPDGGILISGPIEIGPALLMKELSRYFSGIKRVGIKHARLDHSLRELLGAALLGSTVNRADNIKCCHKGFDFRQTVRYLRAQGWRVKVLGYGPLPIDTWYGNSQVFLWTDKPGLTGHST